ncbi:MCE family protein [Amycolatopsis aidingensis]|uniref:MCE family protein n=1 Tax=Amycolatopsis aidingensis TaxID=2842453 RepID=UPI001C0D2D9C|nr:MCE family protein [Amycolatopsis aidingensis]
MTRARPASRGYRLLVLACVGLLVLATGLWWFARIRDGHTFTAYFDRAVGVYAGSDVRVLGMRVGAVREVVPDGDRVRVRMTVAPEVRIPAGAGAVIIAPTLVSDRYVQLTPVYTGGAVLRPGAVIGLDRTAVPVELDELVRQLDELATALGPEGANSDGALSRALDTGAAVLEGNGARLGRTIERLGAAAETLEGAKGDLFGTIDGLARFTRTLAESDAQLRELSGRLTEVTGFLAGERENLGAAMGSIATALTEVHDFVADNRASVQSNVDKLTGITGALVEQRAALAEVLDVAPLLAANGLNTYDQASGTLQARANLNELTSPPILMVCQLLAQSAPEGVPALLTDTCARLAPILDGTLKLPSVAETVAAIERGELPPLPLPLLDTPGGTSLLGPPEGGGW